MINKITETFNKAQKYYEKHEKEITPYINLAQRVVNLGSNMREKTNAMDWINFSWEVWKEYKSNVKKISSDFPNHRGYGSGEFTPVLVNLFKVNLSDQIVFVSEKKNESFYQISINDIILEWKVDSFNNYSLFYVSKNIDASLVLDSITKIFWEFYKSNKIKIHRKDHYSKIILDISDIQDEKFIESSLVDEEYKEISKYIDNGYNRSVLYYGPPGSGKSNLMKGLIHKLNGKVARFDLTNFYSSAIIGLIDLIRPDVIILEDLDSALDTLDLDECLSILEEINKRKITLLATANQIGALKNAMFRPERFDKIKEIIHLESDAVRSLVNNDEEIFSLVKDWPAAFIRELMKRIDVLGKEKAMSSKQDLEMRVKALGRETYNLD